MYYPDDVIEEVRTRNDIVDVISQYVNLKKKGANYFGLCPFHNEKTASFSVNSEKQFYYCFGCGAAGNVFSFLMEMENLDFPEAMKKLAERAHINLPEPEKSAQVIAAEQTKQRLFDIHTAAGRYFYDCLQEKQGEQARAYLTKRQMDPRMARKFGIGYSPDSYDALFKHLKEKGFTLSDILKSGLVLENKDGKGYHDRFRGRLMFPIFDVQGRVVGFGGRILAKGEPKYLNSPETILFSKSRNLYGLNFAKAAKKRELILVEGYMDMLSIYQAGFKNVVASLGTAFNNDHARTLKRFADDVILLYDSDEAGTNAALRAIPVLVKNGFRVKVTQVPDGKDPDEFIKKYGDFDIAGACYPEKHFEAKSMDDDLDALKNKVNLGAESLISQLFFDNEVFYRFEELVRARGIQVPICAGIMPITTSKQLGTTVSLSGSSVPKKLADIIATYDDKPEDMRKAGIEYAVKEALQASGKFIPWRVVTISTDGRILD